MHSCSTACADPSDAFQNRDRLRRTSQLDRSSTNASSACVARSASKSSNASVVSRIVLCSRDRTQRSITCVGADGSSAGVQPSRFAYVVKKEYVFQRVTRNRFVVSSMFWRLGRLGVHGELAEAKFQRIALAPRDAITSHGSITLPRLFDIFWPSWSRRSARHTTLRYGERPNTSVLTASSE